MDELAVALKMDPLELRYRNYSDRDQNADAAFTSKRCASVIVAARRPSAGSGAAKSRGPCATVPSWSVGAWRRGIWEALDIAIATRVVLTANGHAEVACATSDIGTGTYTIMTQVAADMLGLPLENVSARLGEFDAAAVAGGGRVMDRILDLERDRRDVRGNPDRVAAPRKDAAGFPAGRGWAAGRRA